MHKIAQLAIGQIKVLMQTNARQLQRFIFGIALIASIAGIGMTLRLVYVAGCTGDTKTAAYGDPLKALQIENYSILSLQAGLIMGCIAILLMPTASRPVRVSLAILWYFLGDSYFGF